MLEGIVDKGMLEWWNKGIMEIKEGYELRVPGFELRTR